MFINYLFESISTNILAGIFLIEFLAIPIIYIVISVPLPVTFQNFIIEK